MFWEFLYRIRVWEFTIGILGKGTWDRGLVNLGVGSLVNNEINGKNGIRE